MISGMTNDLSKMGAVEARRGLRRLRETRTRFLHATIASSFFVVVIGASLFLGAVMVIGTIHGISAGSAADGRTGRIARALRDGTLCHYMVFDNRTAQTVEDRIGRCDENKPKPRKETPATFTWGR